MKWLRSLFSWLRGDARNCAECRFGKVHGTDLFCHLNPPTSVALDAEKINVAFPIVLSGMWCSKGRR